MSGRSLAGSIVALALVLAGCSPATTTISATGRVRAESVTVEAPRLGVPIVNLDAGFEVTPGATAHRSTVAGLVGLGTAQRVVAVQVRIGDHVKKDEVLVRFDDAALAANITSAKADNRVATATIGVIDSAIDTTKDKTRQVAKKRAEVEKGIAKATKARKQLIAKLGQVQRAAKALPKRLSTVQKNLTNLIATRVGVAKQLAEVSAQLAALPAQAPPTVRAQLTAAKKLAAALNQMDAGIKQLRTARAKVIGAIRQVKRGIPKLKKGIRSIDSNLAKARDALVQLDRAAEKIRNARAELRRNRKQAVIAANNTTAIDAARSARADAVVRAPSDGIVTAIVNMGAVIAPGATVAALGSPAHIVELWTTPAQADQICVGDVATLAFAATPPGRVSRILPIAQYPPTFHTTDEVHLTRAVPVEVIFTAALPPGVPVDVQISRCRTNEVKK